LTNFRRHQATLSIGNQINIEWISSNRRWTNSRGDRWCEQASETLPKQHLRDSQKKLATANPSDDDQSVYSNGTPNKISKPFEIEGKVDQRLRALWKCSRQTAPNNGKTRNWEGLSKA
jgi:hypothetical protein